MITMTIEQIRQALDTHFEGFSGEDYQAKAGELLEANGYVYTNAPCSCPPEFNHGQYGHDYLCGWGLDSDHGYLDSYGGDERVRQAYGEDFGWQDESHMNDTLDGFMYEIDR